MKKLNVAIRSRIKEYLDEDRTKLLDFSKVQFDTLKRRNLRMPIELYQL